jgi:hypothetical protein
VVVRDPVAAVDISGRVAIVDRVDGLDIRVDVDGGLDDRRDNRPGGRLLAMNVLAGMDDACRVGVSAQGSLQQ